MLTGDQIVEIVGIVVGAVVTIATAYLAYEMRRTAQKVDSLRATIASLHAVMMDKE